MPITPGQTYRSADPRELIRIRIKTYVPGENRALVVDAATGKRPRPMLVTALHDSATTQAGKPRRSGYVLETAARTASGQQPETVPTSCICGHQKNGHGLDFTDRCLNCQCGAYTPAVGQPAEAQPADRAAVLYAAAERITLDLTPTSPGALGYLHAITDVVRLLRRLGDEEAVR